MGRGTSLTTGRDMFGLANGPGLNLAGQFEALASTWAGKNFGYQICEGGGKKDKQNQCNFMTTGKADGQMAWLKKHADNVYGFHGPYDKKAKGSHYPYYDTWFGKA